MSIFNPFRVHTSSTKNAWDYVFDLTPSHPSQERMDDMKHTYDEIGERAYIRLSELRSSTGVDAQGEKQPNKSDLYHQLIENAPSDQVLSTFWHRVNHVPSWVDWEQIARGQDCFYRYGVSFIVGLAFESLLAGMGAARIVETLSRTGGFGTRVARRRLYETMQFILQCTRSVGSLKPGGEGFAAAVRVRLLHAAVRKKIMHLMDQDSSYYDVNEWGIPINDLDSIATILSFSATLIWISLPRQG